MKKPIFMLMALGLFAFASCDSPQENRAEERADEIEDRADEMEDRADDMDDDTYTDTTTVIQ
jgi:hypothetical protein